MEHPVLRSVALQEQAKAATNSNLDRDAQINRKGRGELMKAVQMHGYRGIDQLRFEDVRDQTLGADEVLRERGRDQR